MTEHKEYFIKVLTNYYVCMCVLYHTERFIICLPFGMDTYDWVYTFVSVAVWVIYIIYVSVVYGHIFALHIPHSWQINLKVLSIHARMQWFCSEYTICFMTFAAYEIATLVRFMFPSLW